MKSFILRSSKMDGLWQSQSITITQKTSALICARSQKFEKQTGVFHHRERSYRCRTRHLSGVLKSLENKTENRSFMQRVLKPKIIQDWAAVWREHGFKEFIKRKGWKIVAAVFLFYLIRDSFLYIFLPYLAARGLLGC
ncbi:MAG: hypothetical protein E2O76_06900 [Caldithrix sp.]|nr:MAG: hypothetical protein E2O76_06900 [Caldithrix sp.]